jgi:hypothetical protein
MTLLWQDERTQRLEWDMSEEEWNAFTPQPQDMEAAIAEGEDQQQVGQLSDSVFVFVGE